MNASNKLLNASADPSGTQEELTINVGGCFGPIAIWNISESASPTFAEYDIVVDKQNEGVNTGNFSAHDGIDSACVAGFVSPVSEFATIALFGMGLLTLTRYVYLGRRRKRA